MVAGAYKSCVQVLKVNDENQIIDLEFIAIKLIYYLVKTDKLPTIFTARVAPSYQIKNAGKKMILPYPRLPLFLVERFT
jgi:hypothetical protein